MANAELRQNPARAERLSGLTFPAAFSYPPYVQHECVRQPGVRLWDRQIPHAGKLWVPPRPAPANKPLIRACLRGKRVACFFPISSVKLKDRRFA